MTVGDLIRELYRLADKAPNGNMTEVSISISDNNLDGDGAINGLKLNKDDYDEPIIEIIPE